MKLEKIGQHSDQYSENSESFRNKIRSKITMVFGVTALMTMQMSSGCREQFNPDGNSNTETDTETTTGDSDDTGIDTGTGTDTDTGTDTGTGDGDGDMDMGIPDPCEQTEEFTNAAYLIALNNGIDAPKMTGYTNPPEGEEPFLLDFPTNPKHAARDSVSRLVWRKIIDVNDQDDPKYDEYALLGINPDEKANVCWVEYIDNKAMNLPDFHGVISNVTSSNTYAPGYFWIESVVYDIWETNPGNPLTQDITLINNVDANFNDPQDELAVGTTRLTCNGADVVGSAGMNEPLVNGSSVYADVDCHNTNSGPIGLMVEYSIADFGVGNNDVIDGNKIRIARQSESLPYVQSSIPILGWDTEVIPTTTVQVQ